MTVSSCLALWAWLLENEPPFSSGQRLWALLAARRSWILLLAVSIGLLLEPLMQARRMADAMHGAVMSCGFYSCAVAQLVFVARGPYARAMLGRLHDVASAIEAGASADAMSLLDATSRNIRRMNAVCVAYLVWVQLGFVAHVAYHGQPYAPMWPPLPLPLPWRWGCLALLQGTALFVAGAAYVSLISLFSSIVMALTALHKALATQLEAAHDLSEVVRVVALHQRLRTSSREVDSFHHDVVLHMMPLMLAMPLFVTLQILMNVMDVMAIGSSCMVMLLILHTSAICHDLTDASSAIGSSALQCAFSAHATATATLRDTAGELPVTWELPADVATMRALLLVCTVARARPARMSVRGLGAINLQMARKTLRAWYQWTNMLSSLTTSS